MSRKIGNTVVVSVPPWEEESEGGEVVSPIVEQVQPEHSELDQVHPEGLAGHPEIQSLQQWLDLQG